MSVYSRSPIAVIVVEPRINEGGVKRKYDIPHLPVSH